MGAPLKLASQIQRIGASQGDGCGNEVKPHQRPEKAKEKRNRSTAGIAGRALLAVDDLRAAIAWRIEGVPVAEIEAIAAALRPLAADFREARPEVAAVLADLRRPGDRRDAWGLACAVLALDAEQRGDLSGFWSAGFAVVEAARQGRRMPHARSPLTEPMRRFKQANPGCSPDQAFAAFRDGAGDVMTKYLLREDALQVAGWSIVTRDSFIRQYRRL